MKMILYLHYLFFKSTSRSGEEDPVEEEDDGKINPEKAKKWVSGKTEWSYSHKDVILYNLGVGSGPAKDICELRYIYENHEDFMVS